MKKIHLFGIGVIAIAIAIIISTAGDASQYVNFEQARNLAESGNSNKIHVIGELKKDQNQNVIGVNYQPQVDANYLSFLLIDDNNEEQEVVCYQPPASMTDFEKSEKVVVIGRYQKGKFVASEILMKCPSKYEENTIKVSEVN
ncbi:MAG: cytochrome c maturation protein CcmE [Flammeovirgaceae bacterium]|nr:cytochrome c maturation protein CcmE [Flammeovirgaceae bacterium]